MRFATTVFAALIALLSVSGCGRGENRVVGPPEEYQPTPQEVAEVERMLDEREQESRNAGR